MTVLFQEVVAKIVHLQHILKYKYGLNPLTVTWVTTFIYRYRMEKF